MRARRLALKLCSAVDLYMNHVLAEPRKIAVSPLCGDPSAIFLVPSPRAVPSDLADTA
jgi:hypothetical protein